MTADNPHGRAGTEVDNRARRARLAAFLESTRSVWHPAVGGDPEGDHREPGALVLGLDLRSACDLGARFDQAAVYRWDPDALHLVACTGGRHDILGYRATTGTRLGRPAPLRHRPRADLGREP